MNRHVTCEQNKHDVQTEIHTVAPFENDGFQKIKNRLFSKKLRIIDLFRSQIVPLWEDIHIHDFVSSVFSNRCISAASATSSYPLHYRCKDFT